MLCCNRAKDAPQRGKQGSWIPRVCSSPTRGGGSPTRGGGGRIRRFFVPHDLITSRRGSLIYQDALCLLQPCRTSATTSLPPWIWARAPLPFMAEAHRGGKTLVVVDRCCNGTTTLVWSSKMQHGMAGMNLIWYEIQLQTLDHFVHKKNFATFDDHEIEKRCCQHACVCFLCNIANMFSINASKMFLPAGC